jgi:hypothetical protein
VTHSRFPMTPISSAAIRWLNASHWKLIHLVSVTERMQGFLDLFDRLNCKELYRLRPFAARNANTAPTEAASKHRRDRRVVLRDSTMICVMRFLQCIGFWSEPRTASGP